MDQGASDGSESNRMRSMLQVEKSKGASNERERWMGQAVEGAMDKDSNDLCLNMMLLNKYVWSVT